MNKLILVFVGIAITAGAYAQVDANQDKNSSGTIQNQDKNSSGTLQNQDKNSSGTIQNQDNKQDQNVQNNSADKSLTDGVVMQNGKMMQVNKGQTTSLAQNMTMNNGTKIMADGTCIKKDGSKTMLKEGQHMDMSGNLTSVNTNKDKNMYPVPDSTNRK